jgi:hypothetical protein
MRNKGTSVKSIYDLFILVVVFSVIVILVLSPHLFVIISLFFLIASIGIITLAEEPNTPKPDSVRIGISGRSPPSL